MNQTLTGVVVIIAGSALVIFRKKFANFAIKTQNSTFNFHLGKEEIKSSEVAALVTGLVLLVMGILSLLGVIDWK